MKKRFPLAAVLALFAVCGAAVYLGNSSRDVSFAAVLEVWGDVLRDADQIGLKLTRISDADENRLGLRLAASRAFAETQQDRAYVAAVGAAVARGVRRAAIAYEFHVVADPAPNAFALPGGQVYITTGMMDMLDSEAELASVLGHEMSHVDLRHAVERYQAILKAEKLHAAPLGHVAEFARRIGAMEYARYQELDADAGGVGLAIAAGYDPWAAVTVFTRFQRLYAEPAAPPAATPISEARRAAREAAAGYFRSHPPFTERVSRMQQSLARSRLRLAGRRVYLGVQNYRSRVPRAQREFPNEIRVLH